MLVVVDASVTAALLLPDEHHPLAGAVGDAFAARRVIVPWIWWFEMHNLLIVNQRRGRLSHNDMLGILAALHRLAPERDPSPEGEETIALAQRHGLTAYDAAYLELATRRNAALATLDAALIRAAIAETLPILTSP